MQTIIDAIRLNSVGATFFQTGNHVEAIRSLRDAIQAMLNVQVPIAESEFPDTIAIAIDSHWPTQIDEIHTDAAQTPQINGLIYVFDCPLVVPLDVIPASLDELKSLVHMVQTILVFNLSLNFHCYEMQLGSNAMLERAMVLYQDTLSMAAYVTSGHKMPEGIPSYDIIQCLALNNLSHLHYEFCDFHSSVCCVQCMDEILSHADLRSTQVNAAALDEIMLNLMFTRHPTAAQAA